MYNYHTPLFLNKELRAGNADVCTSMIVNPSQLSPSLENACSTIDGPEHHLSQQKRNLSALMVEAQSSAETLKIQSAAAIQMQVEQGKTRTDKVFISSLPAISTFCLMNSRTGTIAAFLHSSFKSEPDSSPHISTRSSMEKSGHSWVSLSICIQVIRRGCAGKECRTVNPQV